MLTTQQGMRSAVETVAQFWNLNAHQLPVNRPDKGQPDHLLQRGTSAFTSHRLTRSRTLVKPPKTDSLYSRHIGSIISGSTHARNLV